jgi:hypothetical protein
MSTSTGALRVARGFPTGVAISIAAAVIAAIVTIILWTTFTGTDARPTTDSVTETESVGSVPRTLDRPTAQDPTPNRVTVGGEGPAQYHPLP